MKYRVDLTINGHLEVEADSEIDARMQVEDGYSIHDVEFDDDFIDEVYPVELVNQK